MIEIRPFQEEDWGMLLALANKAVPFAQQGNIAWLNNRKAFNERQRLRRHCIATMHTKPVGYGCVEQQSDDPAWLRVFVVCSPELLHREVGLRLYDHLLEEARALGAAHLWAQEYQADLATAHFFISRGFREVRRFTPPDELPMVAYQLDLNQTPPVQPPG